MKKYKAIISDFDGTLFSSDGRIPEENIKALHGQNDGFRHRDARKIPV